MMTRRARASGWRIEWKAGLGLVATVALTMVGCATHDAYGGPEIDESASPDDALAASAGEDSLAEPSDESVAASAGDSVAEPTNDAGPTDAPCSTDGVVQDGGLVVCDEGYVHRPQASACASTVPHSDSFERPSVEGVPDVEGVPRDECHSDADCPGALGYCHEARTSYDGFPFLVCDLGCLNDDDCGEGSLCVCGDPIGTCVSAQCRTDTDCPSGSSCLGVVTSMGYLCPQSYQFACYDSDAECLVDADCGLNMRCSITSEGRMCSPQVQCS